jgi:pyruvate, water dikinase
MNSITWFDCDGPVPDSELGGKNAALRALTRVGMPVPLGFAVTSSAFRDAIQSNGMMDRLTDMVASISPTDPAALTAAAASARALVRRSGIPDGLRSELDRAYRTLAERCSEPDVPVVVRSSATSEDGHENSFAGAYDTFLCVRSADQTARRVLECWASLYTERAVVYRRALGQREDGTAMSVGVQRMVRPLAAGVAFTLNPRDGDRSMVRIEASWGFGETVVAGAVTPDCYLLDKAAGRIARRLTARKTVEYGLNADSSAVVRRTVDPARQCRACLTDDQAREVAELACRAERHFGPAQDVEWAIEQPRAGRARLWLLQSRPETAWSRLQSRPETAWSRPGGQALRRPTAGPSAKARRVPGAGDGAERFLTGHAASAGVAEGFARVIVDAKGIGGVRRGEILVAPETAPAWLPAFDRVSAIVTDHGGMTSHAAIVCREYGLPAVTGTETGTAEIVTGQWLRVDGAAGLVVILGMRPPRAGS